MTEFVIRAITENIEIAVQRKVSIFPLRNGKKIDMVKRSAKINEAGAQEILQYLSVEKCLRSMFDNRRVKVIFSDNLDAPTLENALVKIASKRIL